LSGCWRRAGEDHDDGPVVRRAGIEDPGVGGDEGAVDDDVVDVEGERADLGTGDVDHVVPGGGSGGRDAGEAAVGEERDGEPGGELVEVAGDDGRHAGGQLREVGLDLPA